MTKTFRMLPPKSEDHGFDVEKLSYFVYTYYIVLNLRLYFGIYTSVDSMARNFVLLLCTLVIEDN